MPTPKYTLVSDDALDYQEADNGQRGPESAPTTYRSRSLFHAIAGYRVPALPASRDLGGNQSASLKLILHRFASFISALHHPADYRALSLHLMAHPERSQLGAEVGVYILCRTAADSYTAVVGSLDRFTRQVFELFPTEGLFTYSQPARLTSDQLQEITFQCVEDKDLCITEIRKHEDLGGEYTLQAQVVPLPEGCDYIPHPFWADVHLDPWLALIELLACQTRPVAISVVLEPSSLFEIEAVAALAEQYRQIADRGQQREQLKDRGTDISVVPPEKRSFLQSLRLGEIYGAQRISDYTVVRAQRGQHVYGRLVAAEGQVFTMRVTIVAREAIPEALTQSLCSALCSPDPDTPQAELGWHRPVEVVPDGPEKVAALRNLRWLGHLAWGATQAHPYLRRLRELVTAEEAVGLFHLPVFPQAGQTTALSTAYIPFVVPPEVATRARFKADDRLVNFGYLYQRERWLHPSLVGEHNKLAFELRLDDLEKPSLLVGAPGSGKSNLALHLLAQLQAHKVPFLVLDPSTGQEYRYLFAHSLFSDNLILYTLGDQEGLPLQFNPFEIPAGTTVRSHITRLLACFKAAYEMWDPLPAIYEAAMIRLYTETPFDWSLDAKGASGHPSPCLQDFASVLEKELNENVLPDYGHGTEAAGILTGASKIRINGIINSSGHVLNVRDSDPMFFQRLLQKPVVIELGALGDPTSIALVMAFLVTQLAGHIEYAYHAGMREQNPHLLLIEEAHRLLSAESPATASPNQGNVRGKSAEELNSLLAEVRKFRQGIMVLDQRPSSLVGGVLDNALINIMCRLNDRAGFEHLSNMLNLSAAQQRYARTRLKPGDAIMLDSASGEPILVRAEPLIDDLRTRKLQPSDVVKKMLQNATKADLLPPTASKSLVRRRASSDGGTCAGVDWTSVDGLLDQAVVDRVKMSIESQNWNAIRKEIRGWIGRNRAATNPVLEQAILSRMLQQLGMAERGDLIAEFAHPEYGEEV